MENNQSSFWKFSDQLRLQTNAAANAVSNLSLNDSIWTSSYSNSKRPETRRNFDIRVGGDVTSPPPPLPPTTAPKSDFNGFNFDWKMGGGSEFSSSAGSTQNLSSGGSGTQVGLNGGFNRGIYSKPSSNFNNLNLNLDNNIIPNTNFTPRGLNLNSKNGKFDDDHHPFNGVKNMKNKKHHNNNNNNNNVNEKESKNSVDERFKTAAGRISAQK